MSEFAHVESSFRHMLEATDEERIRFLDEPRWIGYERAQYIIDTLHRLMMTPKRQRMPNLLIIGHSNAGKSTILERFEDLYGKAWVDQEGEPVRPVVRCQAPANPSEKGLYVGILRNFLAPFRESHSTIRLQSQVLDMLRYSKTRILIIDELHSLLSGTPRAIRQTMNVLKFLCNELQIPIVGAGLEHAKQTLQSDPQHKSRFDLIEIKPWKLNGDFQRLLAGFEKTLPLKKQSLLHERDKAVVLHEISAGSLGHLRDFLVKCATDAIGSGKERIDLEVIRKNS